MSQTKLDHTETVYNFEVQDFHTYHIGEYGVWVHNDGCCGVRVVSGNIINKAGDFYPNIPDPRTVVLFCLRTKLYRLYPRRVVLYGIIKKDTNLLKHGTIRAIQNQEVGGQNMIYITLNLENMVEQMIFGI
ncbi:HINT domain-containing protein [Moraxella catarrhalis]|uniref:HINT domain-containing protein n=1 Tax=Moraxella catarrhalis TaxID=480 RepID=UPI001F4DE5E8|nr:HINT domain-containing protein [Moraxella catarrhalis]